MHCRSSEADLAGTPGLLRPGRGLRWSMAALEDHVEARTRPPARWPAVGGHVGLLLVAFSAAWTLQPEGWFNRGQWLSFALIGLMVLIVGIQALRGRASNLSASALLALGAATALYLAYDPQLTALPGLTALGAGPVGALEPSLAHLGVFIAGVFAALYAGLVRPRTSGEPPFAGAVVAAAVLVLVLAGIMWLALHNLYDLSGTSGIGMLAFRVVSFSLLLLSCLVLAPARGVYGLAQLYMGLALLIAVARNFSGMS